MIEDRKKIRRNFEKALRRAFYLHFNKKGYIPQTDKEFEETKKIAYRICEHAKKLNW